MSNLAVGTRVTFARQEGRPASRLTGVVLACWAGLYLVRFRADTGREFEAVLHPDRVDVVGEANA